jgi:hypothetical protein
MPHDSMWSNGKLLWSNGANILTFSTFGIRVPFNLEQAIYLELITKFL